MVKKQKRNEKYMILIGAVLLLFVLAKGGYLGFLGAVINPVIYNGDMEEWCIKTQDDGSGFGDDPKTGLKCDDTNSIGVLNLDYDGLSHTNEIPQMWFLKYGCCTKQTTDAYEGQYATLIHKESMDDWYGFGMTNDGHDNSYLPATSGRTYTLSVYYKTTGNPSRDGSLTLKFYDVNRNEIPESSQGSSFLQATEYTRKELIGTAPQGTAYMGWVIWIPVDAVVDLYLDNLEIDESDPCTPAGSTGDCGVDLGICSYGQRVCGADGNWGECIGGTPPIKEMCENNVDDDCDGQTDEYCTYEAYSNTELVTKYDTINEATYGTKGFVHSNSVTWWAWDNAPIMEANLNMYEYTKDTKYLDYVVTNTDTMIGKASDNDGDGLLDWQALENPIDPILTYSRNLLPIIKFVYVVKDNDLTAYDAKANEYLAFVEDNFIPLYDTMWNECGDMGYWTEGTHSAPNNRAAFVGRTHLYMYLITGNETYYDQSVRYANKIKSTLQTRTDGPSGTPYYFWHYNDKAGCITNDDGTRTCSYDCTLDQDTYCDGDPDNWMCLGPVEIGYGNYDIMLMLDYYEANIVFDNSDLNKLTNTFKEGLLLEDALVDGIRTPVLNWKAQYSAPVDWKNGFAFTPGIPHWARLGYYDSKIKGVTAEITKFVIQHNELVGDWYSHPYLCVDDLRDSAPELCLSEEDSSRSTSAYTLSTIGHQLRTSETLTPLNVVIIEGDENITIIKETDTTPTGPNSFWDEYKLYIILGAVVIMLLLMNSKSRKKK